MTSALNCVVVIPVYKSSVTAAEEIALRQCRHVLADHPRCLIAPDGLALENYLAIDNQLYVERFESLFFQNVDGYNQLLLSRFFYLRFIKFSHMLIYQLDAFVFRDELLQWCEKHYDYIGAPWFPDYAESFQGTPAYAVGNGGFSLRRVEAALRVLTHLKILKGPMEIWQEYRQHFEGLSFWLRIPKIILKIFGHQNNSKFFLKNYISNEDIFWGEIAPKWYPDFRIPDTDTAARFAIECDPRYWFERHGSLPFGCHAWLRYDPSFWKSFIPQNVKGCSGDDF